MPKLWGDLCVAAIDMIAQGVWFNHKRELGNSEWQSGDRRMRLYLNESAWELNRVIMCVSTQDQLHAKELGDPEWQSGDSRMRLYLKDCSWELSRVLMCVSTQEQLHAQELGESEWHSAD